ncbi:MAG: hypothetical protein M1817_003801 [Caeruleum heppii]|nr:MAG: hypothetical protein M1817_003801 [Caeruleum heppii]
MSSPAPSIPDTSLGLSRDEILLLRQHQPIALSTHAGSGGRGSGRGSRAGSNASSHAAQGRLMLDPGSLNALGRHFDRLMGAISQRLAQLTHQTTLSTGARSASAASALSLADAEIARFHAILRQIDELEREFDKVRHIRDIVKGFRGRVETLERKM